MIESSQQLGLFEVPDEPVPASLDEFGLTLDPLNPESSSHRVRQLIVDTEGGKQWVREILVRDEWHAHGGYWVPDTLL